MRQESTIKIVPKVRRDRSSEKKDKECKIIVGQILAEKRKILGFNQKDIADEIGCSLSTISLIELGKCDDYRVYTMKAIAEILDIDILILLVAIIDNFDKARIIKELELLGLYEKIHTRCLRGSKKQNRRRCKPRSDRNRLAD